MPDSEHSTTASVTVQSDPNAVGRYDVAGALNLNTVTSVENTTFVADAAGTVTINLAGVESADSSALAVMLGWIQAIQNNGQRVQFEEIPVRLKSLVEIAGLTQFFTLDHN